MEQVVKKALLVEDNKPLILYQGHCCWWPAHAMSQVISNDGTDPVILEYSGFSTKRVYLGLAKLHLKYNWSSA